MRRHDRDAGARRVQPRAAHTYSHRGAATRAWSGATRRPGPRRESRREARAGAAAQAPRRTACGTPDTPRSLSTVGATGDRPARGRQSVTCVRLGRWASIANETGSRLNRVTRRSTTRRQRLQTNERTDKSWRRRKDWKISERSSVGTVWIADALAMSSRGASDATSVAPLDSREDMCTGGTDDGGEAP